MNVNCICMSISNSIDPFTIPFTPFLSPEKGKLVLNSSNCKYDCTLIYSMNASDRQLNNHFKPPKKENEHFAIHFLFSVFFDSNCASKFAIFRLCIVEKWCFSLVWASDSTHSHSNWDWMNFLCSSIRLSFLRSLLVLSFIHWGKWCTWSWFTEYLETGEKKRGKSLSIQANSMLFGLCKCIPSDVRGAFHCNTLTGPRTIQYLSLDNQMK